MAQDGKVVINIDSNASKVARDFQNLSNDTAKYERILQNVAGTSNATLPIYDKIRAKLKEQQAAANSAITSYQKLANAQKSGIGFSQLNSVTGSAIERLRNLALQGRQNSAEFQNLASVVRNANSQIQNANNVVSQAITGSKGFNNSLGLLGGSLGSLKGLTVAAAAGFAAMKLKDYGQYALQTSAAFEQLAISFRVMTGSAQTGQELTDAIIELGAKTPMTAQQLSKAAQLLLSFGESAENIIPDLKLLGDITGGEVNRFNQLSLAFAQVGANGKLMGQDLLQMVNAGFNPLQIMSQTTGKSMGQLRKEMEEGRITFQMVRQAMADAASEGGRYFGLMEQQSQSLNGQLSTLGDTWEQVTKNIGDLFLPVAKSAVQGLISLGEAVLNLQNKMKDFTAGLRHETADSNYKLAEGYRKQAAELQQLAKVYEQRGNSNWAASYRKKAQQFLEVAERFQQKAQQIEKNAQKSVLGQSGANTGFNATVLSSPASSSNVTKQKDAYEKLQLAAQNARREVELNAIAYGTSSPQVQQAFVKYRNLNTQLNDINKIFEENTKKVAENGGAYIELQNKISETRSQLLNMAVSGQTGSAQFTMLKNTLKQYETQAQQANTAVTNSIGLSWSNLSTSISSQLSSALTTPLQEGENAFERLGNVALNVIGQIAQAWLSNSLNNLFSGSGGGGKSSAGGLLGTIGGLAGSFFGPIGSAVGGFFGNTIGKLFNANGNAFVNGHLQPFANGGVVSSPTMFPMSGNRTGIMGEKGAEAIMPLKRAANGQLGVQAQTAPATVNIYNQSDSRIETVQRPDGETDVFIRRVNNALRNERTQAGFSSALQRNQSRGVQAS